MVDVLVIGAGAAGLNAALSARDRELSCILLEKAKVANTIENFPEGKWVYAEPDSTVPKGKLWLDGAQKEDLIERWHQIVDDNEIDVRLAGVHPLAVPGFARWTVAVWRSNRMDRARAPVYPSGRPGAGPGLDRKPDPFRSLR